MLCEFLIHHPRMRPWAQFRRTCCYRYATWDDDSQLDTPQLPFPHFAQQTTAQSTLAGDSLDHWPGWFNVLEQAQISTLWQVVGSPGFRVVLDCGNAKRVCFHAYVMDVIPVSTFFFHVYVLIDSICIFCRFHCHISMISNLSVECQLRGFILLSFLPLLLLTIIQQLNQVTQSIH